MQQPLGFAHRQHPSYVCHLHKALCGLKQAPTAWFHKLSASLTTWGFESSCADTSLFFKHATSNVLLILVYVDDILVTSSCASQVTFFISQLSSTFSLRDLGSLYYFFGIGVTHSTDSLHLCQQKYVHDLLTRTAITDAKLVLTLGSLAKPLSLTDGDLLHIATLLAHCSMLLLHVQIFLLPLTRYASLWLPQRPPTSWLSRESSAILRARPLMVSYFMLLPPLNSKASQMLTGLLVWMTIAVPTTMVSSLAPI